MKIRPGRNLVRVVAALAAGSLLTFFWSGISWLLAAGVVTVSVLAALEYEDLHKRLQHVTISRSMPSVAGRNNLFRTELRIANSGRTAIVGALREELPAVAVPNLQQHVFQVTAAGSECLVAEFRVPVRGLFEFGPVWVRLSGRHELPEAQRCFPCAGKIKILPEGFSSKEGLQHDERAALLLLDKQSKVRQQGAGTEFETLSEYRPGDDPRRIDWKTTARIRRPVVRRFQVERHRDVMIIIDCGRLMGADAGRGSKLDCAVDSALMLCRTVLENGDRCGVALFDDQILGYLPPVAGLRSLRALTESVYDVESRWRESDFSRMFAMLQSRQSKRSLVVVLSDIVDVETSSRFRTSLHTLSQRHLVLFAALKTPLLRELVHQPVETLLDGSRKAVTFRILREREQAIHALKRGGVHVLDVEPSRLTVPLINHFVMLRQQNRL